MSTWSDELKDSPFGDRESPETGRGRQSAIDLVIGVDYGTRFTKVAVGAPQARAVWQDDAGKRLIPSIVYVAADGAVSSYPSRPPVGCDKVEYLKMLLADPDGYPFRGARTRVNGIPIIDVVRPLAAAFLSGIVREVQASLLRRDPTLKQREITWLLNVGAPVAHYDANLSAFKEVAAVAFEWARKPAGKANLEEIRRNYGETVGALDIENSPASIVPELTAALHQFVKDPNRSDNLYGFCDIGGGTLDGAIFRVNRSGIGKPLVIYATRVDSTGTMAVSRIMLAEMYSRLGHYIEGPLVGSDLQPGLTIPLDVKLGFRKDKSVVDDVQTLVATIIGRTRKKLSGEVFSPRLGDNKKNTPPLRVFLAGGGAGSGWYQQAIEQTFGERNLTQWGLTGIRPEIVSRPPDYRDNDYPRFVIALGLADALAALAEARLPSQLSDAEPMPERQMLGAITKDMV